MTTNVYVYGVNLYYRALKYTPYKWLDLENLATALLPGRRTGAGARLVAPIRMPLPSRLFGLSAGSGGRSTVANSLLGQLHARGEAQLVVSSLETQAAGAAPGGAVAGRRGRTDLVAYLPWSVKRT